MKRIPMILALTVSSLTIWTAAAKAAADERPLVINVWPGKPAGDVGIAGEEQSSQSTGASPTTHITNVSTPTLSVFRPAGDLDNGAAVVICPGGGYHDLAWDKEGTEVAAWMNSLGVTGIVLKYRVPRRANDDKNAPPAGPLMDAQRAISLVRSKAKAWGIDPERIGMIGFSAGGHLTAATVTNFGKRSYEPIDEVDTVSCRPDFGILAYPAYLVVKGTGELSPSLPVSAETPPLFFVHCGDDTGAKVENSLVMYRALNSARVRAELHVFATGGHGFGTRGGKPYSTWTLLCAEWMKNRGFFRPSAE